MTVYFEDGFWHGLFEQVYRETYQVCRVTFGQEPKDDEILEMLQTQFTHLSFSPEATVKQHVKIKNPKRLQRVEETSKEEKFLPSQKELLQLQYEEKEKRFQNINLVPPKVIAQTKKKFERKQQNEVGQA